MVKFCPLVSGSDGNSVYIGTEYTNILIDAGLSGKKIEEELSKVNVIAERLDGIFVTHEHSDHVQSVGILSRRYDLPVYATEGTWEAMDKPLGKIARKNRRVIYCGEKMEFNDLIINSFGIPHDAAEPVGYSIIANSVKMSVATDIGHITEDIKEGIADSDILLIEANHDVEMLKAGTYPYSLKQRILSDIGHLSNANAGKILAEMATSKLKHVFLGHLSHENNRPELAYKTVENFLYENRLHVGKDFHMEIARRKEVSRLIQM